MNNKELYVMVGCPGAGKDYWIEHHKNGFEGNVGIISRDKIRYSKLKEGEDYFSHESEVFRDFCSQINESLVKNDVTIVNATHLNRPSRYKLFKNIKCPAGTRRIAMVINTPLKTCLEQNARREGLAKVPEDQLKNMFENLTIPSLEEGFDTVYIYSINGEREVYKII